MSLFDRDIAKEVFQRRAATEAELPAIVALVNAVSIAASGVPDTTEEAMRQEWQEAGFEIGTHSRVTLAPDGQLVGYADFFSSKPLPVLNFVFVCVHPDHEGQGIGEELLAWGEALARQSIPLVPDNLRVAMRSWSHRQYEPGGKMLAAHGMQIVRHFWRMVITLDAPPPAPLWPDTIALRPFDRERDERAVYRAMDEAFQDHWGHIPESEDEGFERWAHRVFNPTHFDPTLWAVAMDGDEIAGFVRATLQSWEEPEIGWVNQLAVRRPWRKQGLGMALLHHAFGELYRRGKSRIGLAVDGSNPTGATRLYERAGMRVARQFTVYEKELRPGDDITTH